MPRYAVAYMNLMENELTIEFVDAETERDAVLLHSGIDTEVSHVFEWLKEMPEELDEIKEYFFNADAVIDVKEVC